MSEETAPLVPDAQTISQKRIVSDLNTKGRYADYLRIAGMATILGGVTTDSILGYLHQPASSIAAYSIYVGIALSFLGTILYTAYRSNAAVKDKGWSSKDPDEFTRHTAPRWAATFGAILAAGSATALLADTLQHGARPLNTFGNSMIGTLGAGLAILVIASLIAHYQAKRYHLSTKRTGPTDSSPHYSSFFFSRGLVITGAVAAGTGITLMRTGIWSPGVNTLLVGAGLILTGAILDSMLFFKHEGSGLAFTGKEDLPENVAIHDEVSSKLGRSLAAELAGALTITGLGISVMHKYLSSPAYHPSIASPDMAALIALTAFTIMAMLSSIHSKNKIYENDWQTNPDFYNPVSNVSK